MSDQDDIYRYTSRKSNLWNSYQPMRTDYEVSDNIVGTPKAASGNVLDAIGVINEYVEQSRSTQQAVTDVGIHKAVQEQLAEGQEVKVVISDVDGKTEVDIYRSNQSVMHSSENETRSFNVSRPTDNCAIKATETTEFKIPTESGIVTEKLGGSQPSESVRSEPPPVTVPEIVKEATPEQRTSEPPRDTQAEKERAEEREREEVQATMP